MITDLRLLQEEKASKSISVTELGISTDVSPEPAKATKPIYLTDWGITMDFSPLQPPKA